MNQTELHDEDDRLKLKSIKRKKKYAMKTKMIDNIN